MRTVQLVTFSDSPAAGNDLANRDSSLNGFLLLLLLPAVASNAITPERGKGRRWTDGWTDGGDGSRAHERERSRNTLRALTCTATLNRKRSFKCIDPIAHFHLFHYVQDI